MATIMKILYEGYHYLNEEVSDPRTKDWFLVGNCWPILTIIAAYLYFVHVLGPRWMSNKKPFKLDRIIQVYNVIQIGLNIILFYEAVTPWLHDYRFECQPVDYSMNPKALRIASAVWLYYMVKVLDLLDTIFFVLRKKQSQISFLHVYHHSGMVFGGWAITKYLPGGHVTFVGLINSFVHVILYTHYLVTSMKIAYPWWRKYITQLQLIQFFMIFYHFVQLLMAPDCGFPKWPCLIFIPQNLFMIILFSEFYYKAYIKKRPPKENSSKDGNGDTISMNGKSKKQ